MLNLDQIIIEFDKGMRTLFAPAHTLRPMPGRDLPDAKMSAEEKRLAAALMRVDHSGEICAQALYQGQALTARTPELQAVLQQAAQEETEHLSWCEKRIEELGGRKSLLNPLFYAGSLAVGALAGALGDKWNLGFLAETENQVERHLESHLARIPKQDEKSRAILNQMKEDEVKHATAAIEHGGAALPAPAVVAMKLASKVMTESAFRI